MIGGDLLATGSSSCVFRPNIPCKNSKDKVSNKKISKIVYGEKADRYYDKEKKISHMLKSIKGHKKWSIVYDKFCEPPNYDNIFKYDKQLLSCKDREYEHIFNGSSKMMVSKYGGITLEDYFIDTVLKDRSFKKIESAVFELLKKMKQLFIGLNEIYKNKLIHLDIKYNNVVLDGIFFKYIDFGLSSELNDLDHFKTRSLSEFNTKRIYLWYPPEYLYSSIESYDKLSEYEKLTSGSKFRKHYRSLIEIHTLFDVRLNNYVKNLLKISSNPSDNVLKELICKIDVYSLGIMIPFFFVEYDLVEYIEQSAFLKDLFRLCKDMCKLDYRERITPDVCLKRYNQLMRKYSYIQNTKGKKTLKKNK